MKTTKTATIWMKNRRLLIFVVLFFINLIIAAATMIVITVTISSAVCISIISKATCVLSLYRKSAFAFYELT
jgi:hypothetical protein